MSLSAGKKFRESVINDTYAEINLKKLKKNFTILKKLACRNSPENVRVCSIIKANAYGHGMNETGKFLAENGTDYLGTADYPETESLTKFLKKHRLNTPVLCLGTLSEKKKYFDTILSGNIEATIADIKSAEFLNNYAGSRNKKVKIQIQVDSGINRTGFPVKDTFEAYKKIAALKNLKINGVYSHYSTSEIPRNYYAQRQLRDFKNLLAEIEHNIEKVKLKHISNSGGILNFSDGYFNMVRPGISLYGYYPGKESSGLNIGIEPVMSLKSRVSFIKQLEKNESISYGRKYITKKRTKIVSIPVGYGDGYPRLLTNKSKVIINGKFYRTAGTVCMDWIMADIGMNSDVKLNDEVTVFGNGYTAEKLAELTGMIPYEITCNISARVQRVYVTK